MLREIKHKIENIKSLEDKITIEAEIEVLNGVDSADIDEASGNCHIKFDGEKISSGEIIKKIKELGFEVAADEVLSAEILPREESLPAQKEEWSSKNLKEHVYKVEGMHCASCEILIEKKLLMIQNIKSVDASTPKGEVVIEYSGDRPNPERLSKIFKGENYQFDDLKFGIKTFDNRILMFIFDFLNPNS